MFVDGYLGDFLKLDINILAPRDVLTISRGCGLLRLVVCKLLRCKALIVIVRILRDHSLLTMPIEKRGVSDSNSTVHVQQPTSISQSQV